jgi:hypothetical protein
MFSQFRLFSRNAAPLPDHIATLQDGFRTYHKIPEKVRQNLQTDRSKYNMIEQRIRNNFSQDTPEGEILDAIVNKAISVEQYDTFHNFFRYTLSVSHMKMRARLSNSTSMEYFRHLCSITKKKLDVALKEHPIETTKQPHRTIDIPLCTTMLNFETEVVEVVASFLAKDVDLELEGTEPRFDVLLKAFRQLYDFHESPNKHMKDCPRMYTSETAVEFHFLLLGTIRGLMQTLRCFNPSKSMESASDLAEMLPVLHDISWMFANLLWRISNSSMLREHLSYLAAVNLLQLKSDDGGHGVDNADSESNNNLKDGVDNVDEAMQESGPEMPTLGTVHGDIALVTAFVQWISWMFANLLWRISNSSMFREHPSYLAAVNWLQLKSDDGGHGVDNVDEAIQESGPEIPTLGTVHGDIALVTAFVQWARLPISHITVLDNLLVFLQRDTLREKILRIHAVAVRKPKTLNLRWAEILRDVLPEAKDHNGTDPTNAAIKTIGSHITQHKQKYPKDGKSVFSQFNHQDRASEDEWLMVISPAIHCEVALALLLTYFGSAETDEPTKRKMERWLDVCIYQLCYLS